MQASATLGALNELQSDTVEWEMKTGVGQSCIRGIRFKLVANPVIKIITQPRFGALTLQGPSFSYTAGADFQEDSFTVEVSGLITPDTGRFDEMSGRFLASPAAASVRAGLRRAKEEAGPLSHGR